MPRSQLSFRFAPLLAGAALAAGLTAAAPARAAGSVPYHGTEKADRIDFRYSQKSYNITGLGGNDFIYSGLKNDTVDGGKGSDTIEPGGGDDIVRGGPDGDYFRYETSFDGYRYFNGSDTICDFGKGDKLDVYTEFLDGDGHPDSESGGNFALFDTNKDGVVDKKDQFSSIKKVKTCGSAKDSLVLDVNAAFEKSDDSDYGDTARIILYGKTSLKKSEFAKDYGGRSPY